MPSKLESSKLDRDNNAQPVERITMVTRVERQGHPGDAAARLFFVSAVLLGLWVLTMGATTGAEVPVFRSFEIL